MHQDTSKLRGVGVAASTEAPADCTKDNLYNAKCAQEYRLSPAEQSEKDAHYHADRAQKSFQAAEFFRAHPEFSEFIQLLRSGVIGF